MFAAGRSKEVAECEGLINDAIEVVRIFPFFFLSFHPPLECSLIFLFFLCSLIQQLETMELGVRSVSDPNEKSQMEGRIYNYREQLDTMKEDMRLAESELSDKDKLFSGLCLFVD